MSTTTVTTSTLAAVCKLRWVPKRPDEQMTITNLEALRLMATAILLEQKEDWVGASAAEEKARKVLDGELRQFLHGIKHTIPFAVDGGISNADLGDP